MKASCRRRRRCRMRRVRSTCLVAPKKALTIKKKKSTKATLTVTMPTTVAGRVSGREVHDDGSSRPRPSRAAATATPSRSSSTSSARSRVRPAVGDQSTPTPGRPGGLEQLVCERSRRRRRRGAAAGSSSTSRRTSASSARASAEPLALTAGDAGAVLAEPVCRGRRAGRRPSRRSARGAGRPRARRRCVGAGDAQVLADARREEVRLLAGSARSMRRTSAWA